MAAIPPIQQLNAEQLPADLRQQLDPVLRQLNQFLPSVGSALNRKLTFGENFAAQLQQVTFSASDEWIYPGIGSGPKFASSNLSQYPGFPFAFRKRADGDIELNQGLIQSGASVPTNDQVLFTLPTTPTVSAWAPAVATPLVGMTRDGSSNDVFASFGVDANGNVRTRFLASWYANSFLAPRGRWTPADRSPVWPAPFPLTYASTLAGPTAGVILVAATVTDPTNKGIPDPTAALSLGLPDWVEVTKGTERTIKIRGIPGLVPGKSYRVTLLSFQG